MEMIQQSELVTFKCPNCGYITKDKREAKINCAKCTPDFKGWATRSVIEDLSSTVDFNDGMDD